MKVCPECDRQFDDDAEFCAKDGVELDFVEGEIADPMVGRVLDGRWKIEERLGQGGMGTIYLASQKSVGREVAVKTLRESLSDNEEFTERFMREARVTCEIHHPHCVTIYDFGRTEGGTLFLAMELLEGEPLEERLQDDLPSMGDVLDIGAQVASALSAAHDRGIVHRDLKPENVFLIDTADDDTFAKVLDFGISKELEGEDDLTQTGKLFGTPSYMSPEQSKGEELDGRSDLYGLGCMLYEMTVGEPPFTGDKPMAVLMAHVQGETTPLKEAAARPVPDGFAELVDELLAKEPEGRPASAGAVKERLAAEATGLRGTGRLEPGSGDRKRGEASNLARSETLAADDRGADGGSGPPRRGESAEPTAAEPDIGGRGQLAAGVVVGCIGVTLVAGLAGASLLAWGPGIPGLAVFGGDDGGEDAGREAEVLEGGRGVAARADGGPEDVRVVARESEERVDVGGAGEDGGSSGGSEPDEQRMAAGERAGGDRESEERTGRAEAVGGSRSGSDGDGDRSDESTERDEATAADDGRGSAREPSESTDDETEPTEHLEEAEESVDERSAGSEEADERESASEAKPSDSSEEESGDSQAADRTSSAELATWSQLTVRPPCEESAFEARLDRLRSDFGRCASRNGASGEVGVEFDLVDTGEKLRMQTWGSAADRAGSCVARRVTEADFPAPESGICFTRFVVELQSDGG